MEAKGPSLTVDGATLPRFLSLVSGLGMMIFSVLTIQHYFAANFPETIYQGSFCDLNAFFNCDSSAYSELAEIAGIPLGYFGLLVGGLVALGSLFPSVSFERTNKSISLLNAAGVVALFLYTVFVLGSLCLLCSGFYLFSLLSLLLFWRYGIDRNQDTFLRRWVRPSVLHLSVYAVALAAGGYGFMRFHEAKVDAQTGGVASRVVDEYLGLPEIPLPSTLSPLWSVRSTDAFEEAPIRIVEYGDLLCSDCRFLAAQMSRLEEEFQGKINVIFQPFPLEGECNDVVEKDLHPGACEITYMAAHDPEKFKAIHDEIWASWPAPKDPQWRQELARRHGVEDAVDAPETRALVQSLIQTGKEYERTSDRYSYGIRSTPTMIINGRMVIGTLPYEQLKAIVETLIRRAEGNSRFMESWERG